MPPSTDPTSVDPHPVRIAAMGDLHIAETANRPYRDLFQEIAGRADILVLCGDLTNYGKRSEAEILADEVASCPIPVVTVLGNHDHECGEPEMVKHHLLQAGARVLDGGEAFEIAGVGFAGCMGAMGGFGRGMLSAFGESYVKAFVREAAEENLKLETGLRMLRAEKAIAVLHYAPIAETLDGEPLEIFPFLGNSRLAETIDLYANVKAVVHGHAHRGAFRGRTPGGVPVYNCAQMVVRGACGRPYALIDI